MITNTREHNVGLTSLEMLSLMVVTQCKSVGIEPTAAAMTVMSSVAFLGALVAFYPDPEKSVSLAGTKVATLHFKHNFCCAVSLFQALLAPFDTQLCRSYHYRPGDVETMESLSGQSTVVGR